MCNLRQALVAVKRHADRPSNEIPDACRPPRVLFYEDKRQVASPGHGQASLVVSDDVEPLISNVESPQGVELRSAARCCVVEEYLQHADLLAALGGTTFFQLHVPGLANLPVLDYLETPYAHRARINVHND